MRAPGHDVFLSSEIVLNEKRWKSPKVWPVLGKMHWGKQRGRGGGDGRKQDLEQTNLNAHPIIIIVVR